MAGAPRARLPGANMRYQRREHCWQSPHLRSRTSERAGVLAGLRIIFVVYLSTVVPWLMAMPMEMSPNIPTTDAVRVPHTADNITRRKMKRGCGANHFACSYEPDLAGDDPGGSGCGCCGCCVGSDCNCPPNTLSPVGTKSIEGCIAAPNHFGPPGKAATVRVRPWVLRRGHRRARCQLHRVPHVL